jgi:hypothetical protein
MESSTKADSSLRVVLSTSGLYGPGTVACWYLVITALLFSWRYDPDARYRPGYKFAVVVSYPAFAILHLSWLLWTFPPDKAPYLRANLLKIIIQGESDPPVTAEYDPPRVSQPWDEPGSDTFQIYPMVVNVNAALRVCENSYYLCIIGILVLTFWPLKERLESQALLVLKTLAAGVAATLFNSLHLLFLCGFGAVLISIQSCLFRFMSISLGACVLIAAATVIMPLKWATEEVMAMYQEAKSPTQTISIIVGNLKRRLADFWFRRSYSELLGYGFVGLLCCVVEFFWVVGTINTVKIAYPIQIFFPDVGISILRYDQLLVLGGGTVVLFATIAGVYTDNRSTATSA